MQEATWIAAIPKMPKCLVPPISTPYPEFRNGGPMFAHTQWPGQQQSTVKVSFDSTLETQQVFTAGGSKSCCFVQGWTHNHNLHACCEAVCGELISATDEHCTWHLRPMTGCMQTIPVTFQQYHKTCAKDICHILLLAAGASQRSLGQQCCQWLQV